MTYYLGRNLDTYNQREERYFYGLKRDDENGFLVLDKINLDKSLDTLEIADLSKVTGDKQIFENLQEGVDFFEGRAVDHELKYDGLNYEQFKWSEDNLYYFVDAEGQLCVRVNTPYNYSEGVTTLVKPQDVLRGSPIDLGLIMSSNPLENRNIVDLSTVGDNEGTSLAIDAGLIV
jgi:hypothetical protein